MLCPQLKINPHHQHHLLLLLSSIGDGHQTRGRPWLVAFFLSLSKELLLPPIVLLLLRGLPVVKSTSIAPLNSVQVSYSYIDACVSIVSW